MTDSNLITIDYFRQIAPEVDTSRYDNPTLSGMISSASKMVSDHLQYTPLAEDITDETKQARVTTGGDLLIYPAKIPVITISAVKISKGSTDVSLSLTNGAGNTLYNIDYNRRMIRFSYYEMLTQGTVVIPDMFYLRGNDFYVKLTYRGGYEVSSLPETIKLATVLYMRDILSRSINTSGATSISQGGISMSFGQRSGKSDLVVDAESLLNPYKRIG